MQNNTAKYYVFVLNIGYIALNTGWKKSRV